MTQYSLRITIDKIVSKQGSQSTEAVYSFVSYVQNIVVLPCNSLHTIQRYQINTSVAKVEKRHLHPLESIWLHFVVCGKSFSESKTNLTNILV